MKAPWLPPKGKLISDEEIKRSESQNKLVMADIKSITLPAVRTVSSGMKKKDVDPLWDQEF